MRTDEANKLAIRGHSQAICRALRALGMRRCSDRLVRRQGEEAHLRLNWYALWWRWFRAVWRANRAGAEFLYEDFAARVEALRAADDLSGADLEEQFAACAGEHAELVQAAFRKDVARIREVVARAIAGHRRLLAILEARERVGRQSRARKRAA